MPSQICYGLAWRSGHFHGESITDNLPWVWQCWYTRLSVVVQWLPQAFCYCQPSTINDQLSTIELIINHHQQLSTIFAIIKHHQAPSSISDPYGIMARETHRSCGRLPTEVGHRPIHGPRSVLHVPIGAWGRWGQRHSVNARVHTDGQCWLISMVNDDG